MKKIYNYWFPDNDNHFESIMKLDSKHEYQRDRREKALSFVKNKINAIDVGGHIGLWSNQLTSLFKNVYAFEPIPSNQECFRLNAPKAILYPFGLGSKEDKIILKKHSSDNSGSYSISDEGIEIDIKPLDSFNFTDISFIKIDVEKYELEVLKGAVETLKREKPVLCVEQGESQKPAIPFLNNLGFKLVTVFGKEHIFI